MGMELERVDSRVAEVMSDGITFTLIVARLALAAMAMLSLSAAVRGAFNYVQGCAKSVDSHAEQAASLGVDDAVVSAHRDAAGVMRGVLADAESLADEAEEMARDFEQARDEHEADYGPVHEAMTNKPGAKAERTYYSNR